MAQQGCHPHIGSDNPQSRRRGQRASRHVSVANATAMNAVLARYAESAERGQRAVR